MTSPSATAKILTLALKLETRGFRIIDADPGAGIRLEFLVSRCESQYEVPHERARVDPRSQTATSQYITGGILQREVGATAKAIVKEIAFNRWTNYARAKDVAELNAAEKADVILRRDRQTVAEKLRIHYVIRKRSVSAAVLINVGAHVDRSVETDSVIWWGRGRRDLLVFRCRPGK